jgi:hypothetical protein
MHPLDATYQSTIVCYICLLGGALAVWGNEIVGRLQLSHTTPASGRIWIWAHFLGRGQGVFPLLHSCLILMQSEMSSRIHVQSNTAFCVL